MEWPPSTEESLARLTLLIEEEVAARFTEREDKIRDHERDAVVLMATLLTVITLSVGVGAQLTIVVAQRKFDAAQIPMVLAGTSLVLAFLYRAYSTKVFSAATALGVYVAADVASTITVLLKPIPGAPLGALVCVALTLYVGILWLGRLRVEGREGHRLVKLAAVLVSAQFIVLLYWLFGFLKTDHGYVALFGVRLGKLLPMWPYFEQLFIPQSAKIPQSTIDLSAIVGVVVSVLVFLLIVLAAVLLIVTLAGLIWVVRKSGISTTWQSEQPTLLQGLGAQVRGHPAGDGDQGKHRVPTRLAATPVDEPRPAEEPDLSHHHDQAQDSLK